jgi:hypothetical protein
MACQTAQPAAAPLAHDPSRQYCAWVYCIDASKSPRDDQFRKLVDVMVASIDKDVAYNDLVWVIPIRSKLEPASMFAMPPGSSLRSLRSERRAALAAAKKAAISAVRGISQTSGTTDLQNPLETALKLLHSQPRAVRRVLVTGSDYVTDTGPGMLSMLPPAPSEDRPAEGVDALLLVTYPQQAYLDKLRASPGGLLKNVETKWASYFQAEGASAVTVLLVDAVAAQTVADAGPVVKE